MASEAFELLETMAYLPGTGLRNEAAHLARLSASANYFDFRLDLESIRVRLHAGVDGVSGPRRVRLLVAPNGVVTVELHKMPGAEGHPVRLALDSEPVSSQSVWLSHKTTRRESYDTRVARHPYADDVILVNEHGQVTDTTIANLAVRLDGTWFTPAVESGCLPGVERTRLVREGALTERLLSVTDVLGGDGLALVSSVRGWRLASLVSPSGV